MMLFDMLAERLVRPVARKAVRDYFASQEFEDKLGEMIAANPLVVFLKHMQARYIERSPGLTMRQAWEHARINLRDFLKGDKIEFGDSQYDWSKDGAYTLVDEDMSYWEAA